jgi:hypothetical protein
MGFVIIVGIITSFVFAYTMNSVSTLLKDLSQKEEVFKEKLGILNHYMRSRNLNKDI